MAIKKTAYIEVKESGLDELNSKVQKVEASFKDVKTEAKAAGNSVEDVTKNGGAIAILDKLTGGLASSFRDSYEATKLFNFSLKGTKTALIATGIGAFVVALGVVVAYFDDIVEFVKGTNKKLEEQNKILGLTRDLTDRRLKFLQEQKQYNDEYGISNEKIIEQEKKLLKEKALSLQLEIKNLETQYLKEASLTRQQTLWEEITNQAPKVTVEELKVEAERKKKILDLKQDLKDTIRLYDDLGAVVVTGAPKPPKPPKSPDDKREKVKSVSSLQSPEEILAESEAQIAAVDEAFNNLFNLKKWQDEQLIGLNKETKEKIANDSGIIEAKMTEDKKVNADKQKRIDYIKLQNQQDLIYAVGDSMSILSNILGAETGKGKAIAVAGALIDTYASIAGQLRAFSKVPIPGYAIAQSILTGLAGFASVKNILAVQVPNSGGAGAGASTPSIQSIAPSFNVVGQSETNQLGQAINNQQNEPIKAYVVSTDVTLQQQMDREIETSATFGR